VHFICHELHTSTWTVNANGNQPSGALALELARIIALPLLEILVHTHGGSEQAQKEALGLTASMMSPCDTWPRPIQSRPCPGVNFSIPENLGENTREVPSGEQYGVGFWNVTL
jgi:hypothetical protein